MDTYLIETNREWIKQGKDFNVKTGAGEIIYIYHLVSKDFINTPSDLSFTGILLEEVTRAVQRILEGN